MVSYIIVDTYVQSCNASMSMLFAHIANNCMYAMTVPVCALYFLSSVLVT